MACCQNNSNAFESLATGAFHAFYIPVDVEKQIVYALSEVYFATVSDNGGAYVGDDAAKAVGADMCVSINGDLWVGAVLDKFA